MWLTQTGVCPIIILILLLSVCKETAKPIKKVSLSKMPTRYTSIICKVGLSVKKCKNLSNLSSAKYNTVENYHVFCISYRYKISNQEVLIVVLRMLFIKVYNMYFIILNIVITFVYQPANYRQLYGMYKYYFLYSVLTSEPHPSCCCFSPHKASLVFAGTVSNYHMLASVHHDTVGPLG